MNANEILELIRAGFTKDEILGLTSTEPTPAPDPEPTPAPDPEPTPEPTPVPSSDSTDVNAAIAALTKQVEELTKAQQAANRSHSQVGRLMNETTDDILAGLINPKKN